MPAIIIGILFIWREDWEGNDGSGVATEDHNNTDVEARGYAHNFLEVGGAFREEVDDNEDDGDEQG
jgi:hypothetical protein